MIINKNTSLVSVNDDIYMNNAADNDRRRETEKQAAEEEKENDDIEAQDSNGEMSCWA